MSCIASLMSSPSVSFTLAFNITIASSYLNAHAHHRQQRSTHSKMTGVRVTRASSFRLKFSMLHSMAAAVIRLCLSTPQNLKMQCVHSLDTSESWSRSACAELQQRRNRLSLATDLLATLDRRNTNSLFECAILWVQQLLLAAQQVLGFNGLRVNFGINGLQERYSIAASRSTGAASTTRAAEKRRTSSSSNGYQGATTATDNMPGSCA